MKRPWHFGSVSLKKNKFQERFHALTEHGSELSVLRLVFIIRSEKVCLFWRSYIYINWPLQMCTYLEPENSNIEEQYRINRGYSVVVLSTKLLIEPFFFNIVIGPICRDNLLCYAFKRTLMISSKMAYLMRFYQTCELYEEIQKNTHHINQTTHS